MAGACEVTLVVPVLDEGSRFARFVEGLVAAAPAAPVVEFLVVDDGSREQLRRVHAAAVARAAAQLDAAQLPHRVRLLVRDHNEGKGVAIRAGWAEAAGTWLAFVDGDGSLSAEETWRFLGALRDDAPFDGLLAIRTGGGPRVVRRKALRAVQGRVFAGIVEAILGLGLRDPQCGAKAFRAPALRPLLAALTERRWLMDLELLAALRDRGARLAEMPIDWSDSGGSAVVPLLDPLRMLVGLFGLRRARRTAASRLQLRRP